MTHIPKPYVTKPRLIELKGSRHSNTNRCGCIIINACIAKLLNHNSDKLEVESRLSLYFLPKCKVTFSVDNISGFSDILHQNTLRILRCTKLRHFLPEKKKNENNETRSNRRRIKKQKITFFDKHAKVATIIREELCFLNGVSTSISYEERTYTQQ